MPKNKQKKVRKSLRGKGDYTMEDSITDPIKRIEAKVDHIERSVNKKPSAKNAASTVGRTLGNFVNQGDLGALAGETLAKLFGHGDYTVKSNSLIPHPGQTLPKFASSKRGTRITEREYLGDVYSGALSGGSTVFTNSAYAITPTSVATFPWLSTIANLFDQWEPHGIVFEFVSTSSEYNGVNQSLGTVIMSTDYDPTDALFSTKQQAENADYSCSTKPSISLMHGIECDPKERPLEVLYTGLTSGDQKFNSLGNFQVCTQGMSSANVVLGELWVSYDITFYKKQQLPLVSLIPYLQAAGTSINAQGTMTGITRSAGYGCTLTNPTTTTSRISFPPELRTGRFWIAFYQSANTVGAVTFTNSTLVLQANYLPSGIQYVVDVTNTGASMTFGANIGAVNWSISLVQVIPDWNL